MEKDYLDELIEERLASDPEFALAWEASELRQQLLELRQRAGMTQQEVADSMGIPLSGVVRIESDLRQLSMGRLLKYLAAVGGTIKFERKRTE